MPYASFIQNRSKALPQGAMLSITKRSKINSKSNKKTTETYKNQGKSHKREVKAMMKRSLHKDRSIKVSFKTYFR